MNFIKSLFKALLTLLFYFVIILITKLIFQLSKELEWVWVLHAIILIQGVLIGRIIYRHNSNKSINIAYFAGLSNFVALLINNNPEYFKILLYMKYHPIIGTGSILFSIIIAYAFSLENFEHWKRFLLNKKNPFQRKVIDDGIPLGKEIIDKFQRKVIDDGIPLGKEMIEKSKPIQSKLKKIISELKFNKPTIIKTALLIMFFDFLIYPPFQNALGDYEFGHHFRWGWLSSEHVYNVDYTTLFQEFILIGIISLGLIYLKSLDDEKKTN